MDPGALLMLRSARGLRSFLYVDVDPCDLKGFEVLEIYHPSMSDGFVNSVMVARKLTDRLIKYEWCTGTRSLNSLKKTRQVMIP
ncbi:unnamed protein product [Arabidopsis thaliana]|uniref:Nicotianamine synthase n=1 Tax=Arabidopsis thaliana TaxID=3702 RepID=A0A654FT08_ARATH|nr:unnamed protein product [Arabidopsis thaliana]